MSKIDTKSKMYKEIKKVLYNKGMPDIDDKCIDIQYIVGAYVESLKPNNEFDVLMNNAIDEMTTEQQLEYYKEYYNLSRQQLQTNKEQLRDEIISELNEWAVTVYPNADDVVFYYADTNSCIGFYNENSDLYFEYHKATKTYEQYDSENESEFTIPLPLASKIIKYFELESE